jgi:membrane-associated phospholipid phosphatase
MKRIRPPCEPSRTFPRVSLLDLDSAGLRLARTRGHARPIEALVAAFSRTGEHAACWLGLGLAGAARAAEPERRALWLRGVRVVAGAYAVNQAIKFIVRRHRPELAGLPPLTPTVSRLSFPSAHATTSFAAARAYGQLAPAWALYGAATMFALSRPYLGVHYPSDVVAGALLGIALAEVWRA